MAKKATRRKHATKRQSPAAKARRQANFLEKFVEIGTVYGAARAIGIGAKQHYRWLEADEEYRAAFAEAERDAVDRLAAEAHRRAVDGVVEPVFYKGEQCGEIRRYSDTLLMFLLKARDPSTYRDRIDHRHGNIEGEGPLQIEIAEVLAESSDANPAENDRA